ncbi:MAG: hypothetical protein H6671_06400 [Anaerolineaceae bacterium]|nr:hypothetical protein [Anaerolineaceae bacterium]
MRQSAFSPSPAVPPASVPATATIVPSPTTANGGDQPPQATAEQPPTAAYCDPGSAGRPADSNYVLVGASWSIPLDTTASVTEFVSYPGGDTEDRVRFSVTGMNPNSSLSGGRARLILAVSCFGTNTDQVQFFTNGQTFTCGQTIVDREVTFDSNTGSVVITAVGGAGTYVQWVLTGTATRVN